MKCKPGFRAVFIVTCAALFQLSVQAQGGKPLTRVPNPSKLVVLLPDLRISKVTVAGSKAEVEIWNRCKGAAAHSYLSLTLYKGSSKDSGMEGLWGFDVPAIAAGSKTTVSIDLSKVGGASHSFEGKYYRFEVDPENKIKETVEGNNWFERNAAPFPDAANSCDTAAAPPQPAGALPDLRITKVTIDGGTMIVEITNQCQGTAVASRLHLNLYGGPAKGSPGGVEFEADTPPIGPGEKVSVSFNLKEYGSKISTFGNNYYRLDADVSNKVKETIEGNNWWEKNALPFPDPANACKGN